MGLPRGRKKKAVVLGCIPCCHGYRKARTDSSYATGRKSWGAGGAPMWFVCVAITL
jgi:hypothetical protein